MRHRVAHRKLGRVTEHRISMLRNQATALLRHEHLTTTVPRRRNCGRSSSGSSPSPSAAWPAATANAKALNARRLVMRDLQDREVVTKLFDTIAPRFAERPGGYTRLLRLGFRKGDSAEIAQVELVGSEFDPRAKAEGDGKAEAPRSRRPRASAGVCRAAAERLRGKKSNDEGGRGRAKPAKGVGRRERRRREKAGGSPIILGLEPTARRRPGDGGDGGAKLLSRPTGSGLPRPPADIHTSQGGRRSSRTRR